MRGALLVILVLFMLVTKEFYVVEEEYLVVLTFIAFLIYVYTYAGSSISSALDDRAISILGKLNIHISRQLSQIEDCIHNYKKYYSFVYSMVAISWHFTKRYVSYWNGYYGLLCRKATILALEKLNSMFLCEKYCDVGMHESIVKCVNKEFL